MLLQIVVFFFFFLSTNSPGSQFLRWCVLEGERREAARGTHAWWFLTSLPIPNFYYLLVFLWSALTPNMNSSCRAVAPRKGRILFCPSNIWQCLKTFWAVAAGGRMCYGVQWVGTKDALRWTGSPTKRMVQTSTVSAAVEKSCCGVTSSENQTICHIQEVTEPTL